MASTGDPAGGRGKGVMEKGSQGRADIRLVPVTGGKRSRDEAPVRLSRVKAVRARIAAGYYDRDEVRDKLVDSLLEELNR